MIKITSQEDLNVRRRVLDRTLKYLEQLPACHLEGRFGDTEIRSVETAQKRILELCSNEQDRATLAELLMDFICWTWKEVNTRVFVTPNGKVVLVDKDDVNGITGTQ